MYFTPCIDLEEQLAPLPFKLPNGKPSRHFFDFRLTLKGGWRICISVKPEKIAETYEYRSKMAMVEKAAIGNICDAVRTITERNIHPIQLYNAKLFHQARRPEPALDKIIEEELAKVVGPTTINAFLERSGIGGIGFRSVARAIHAEKARLVTQEEITGTTLISSKSAA
jgi:hypothetical protein